MLPADSAIARSKIATAALKRSTSPPLLNRNRVCISGGCRWARLSGLAKLLNNKGKWVDGVYKKLIGFIEHSVLIFNVM